MTSAGVRHGRLVQSVVLCRIYRLDLRNKGIGVDLHPIDPRT